MTTPLHIRASDRKDFVAGKRKDFVVRKRGLNAAYIYSLCVMAITVVIGVTILVYNDTLMGSILCVAVGTVMLVISKQVEKQQKLLQATEFLNALFASALGAGHKFCMITKQDGEIVYLDRSFQQMFPDMVNKSKRTLEELLTLYNTSESNRMSLMQALKLNSESKITVQIEGGAERTKQSVAVHIEPILRPSGFCLVRGQAV